MAKNCGIVAVVTDGLVRDIAGLEDVGIPVYARGLTPNSPEKHGPGEIGLPIALGGEAINANILAAMRASKAVKEAERVKG
jgi:4-hydroxy-4-methyl-2-oxoglutarate aldolase